MNVLVLGRGKLGRALLRGLANSGHEAHSTAGRTPDPDALHTADLVVLAVPDPSIADVATRIAPLIRRKSVVVHCAGARGGEELWPCAEKGARTGVLHPMVSFADRRSVPDLTGATFVGSGEAARTRALRALVRAVGARLVIAEVHGPAYHAAAALAANGAVALAWSAVEILQLVGLPKKQAERAIASMLVTVSRNVEAIGVPSALTGPVVRGDLATVQRHREALRALSPPHAQAYDGVLPNIIACAESAGLPAETARLLRAALGPRDQNVRGGRPSRKSSFGEGSPIDSRSRRR